MALPRSVPLRVDLLPDQLDIAMGVAIRIRRRFVGLSQAELGEACGITFQQIQKYENGKNRVAFSRLVQIAKALGCRAADLVEAAGVGRGDTPLGRKEERLATTAGADALLAAFDGLSPKARDSLVELLRALTA